MKHINKILFLFATVLLIVFFLFLLFSISIKNDLISNYESRKSIEIKDRNGEIIKIFQNDFGNFSLRKNDYQKDLKDLVISKEDKYFYFHPGINPFSTIRAVFNLLTNSNKPTSSTITQQLVKILLNNENERTFSNKIKEVIFSIALELYTDKNQILVMYLNTLFLGNQTEGINTASLLYFNKDIELLNKEELLQLLATISSPSNNNPFENTNIIETKSLARKLKIIADDNQFKLSDKKNLLNSFSAKTKNTLSFETDSLNLDLIKDQNLTLDLKLSTKIRQLVKNNILKFFNDNALNASVVIISLNKNKKENEIISIIGSPDPEIDNYGYKINMAIKPRAIGSTIKPFIYTLGFEKNLRPYTLVEDREYKYTIGTGFAFYPKNYDYEYRGEVNLHYALSNSLNVPTLKVLEYSGLENFYSLLENDLEFSPVQELENYQLGIALGELEMDLLTLTNYFTIFPNEGILKPLKISDNICLLTNDNFCYDEKQVFEAKYISLTNKILSDRQTGIEEFGIKSNLNLPFSNYAVKTGTSREFHDSWTVGYSSDFVVGVWVGNAQDQPMDKISGQTGAGKIWQDTMNFLFNSKYNNNNKFDFSYLKEYKNNNNLEIGLKDDDYETQKNLMYDDQLILSPHNSDEFLFGENSEIILKAKNNVVWTVNDIKVGEGKEYVYKISSVGNYRIEAQNLINNKTEQIVIFVNEANY